MTAVEIGVEDEAFERDDMTRGAVHRDLAGEFIEGLRLCRRRIHRDRCDVRARLAHIHVEVDRLTNRVARARDPLAALQRAGRARSRRASASAAAPPTPRS